MSFSVKLYYNNAPIKRFNISASTKLVEAKLLRRIKKNSFIQQNLKNFDFDKPAHKVTNEKQKYGYMNSGPWSMLWKPQAVHTNPTSNLWLVVKHNPLLLLNSLLFVLTLCASLELFYRVVVNNL